LQGIQRPNTEAGRSRQGTFCWAYCGKIQTSSGVFFRSQSNENIRGEVEKYLTTGPKLSTSIDMPLSNECKRIFASAIEEADMLNHRHVGVEHLLLGILREHESVAAQLSTRRA